MTKMALFVAPMMTGMPMDIAAMLGGMVGGLTMGWIAHIMMGVVVFPLAGALVVYGFLPGSPLVRGLTFGVILWAMAVVIVMPMVGAGFLMANIGGMMAVIASLMGHLVYGGLLGAIAGGGSAAEA